MSHIWKIISGYSELWWELVKNVINQEVENWSASIFSSLRYSNTLGTYIWSNLSSL